MNRKRVLVVEDELELARLVELHLSDAGFEVTLAHDGPRGLELATSNPFDAVILDLMLPGLDGLDVCQQIRRQQVYTPILMLTARSSEGDRVLGLEVGADDYLTKPFSVRELVARVKAIFRRVEAMARREEAITVGELHIDPEKRSATLGEKPLSLTAKEFDLLAHFARHPGRVYSRAELLDQVWGYGYGGYEHTVNSHINRLRAKIEQDPAQPRYVLTVWGVGYKLFDPTGTPSAAIETGVRLEA
ncbi:MAG: response regulator transcription factor [Acidobacteriota bacterium]